MEPWEEEGPEVVKRFMYVNRKAPYGTIAKRHMAQSTHWNVLKLF